jgi:hypothetical protein
MAPTVRGMFRLNVSINISIPVPDFPQRQGSLLFEDLDMGDKIWAEVISCKADHGRFNLKPVPT